MSLGSNGLDRVCTLQKFKCDFMAQTCALIAPVQPNLHRIPCSIETLPNAPKCYEMHQNMSLGSIGWIRCVRYKKIQGNFMAWTCALIVPVQPILHQVSCSIETLPNAPKCYETHQNMSLGSNWVDRCVRCEKFQCDFMARPCALIAPLQAILHRVSCSSEILPNAPNTMKHTKTGV